MQNVLISVQTQSDLKFLIDFTKRMGFQSKLLTDKAVDILETKIDNYINSSPKNVPLSSVDVMNEIKNLRANPKKNVHKGKN